jgi:hypothetical protein
MLGIMSIKTLTKITRRVPELNRYTSLPIALDMLTRKAITLLSPETWEDRNDAYYLERYRDKLKFRSVLAVCFSMRYETFHHWKIFSQGGAGVRVEFDREGLLEAFKPITGVRMREVKYDSIYNMNINKPDIEDWPFLKRIPYKDESEFRIIYETKKESLRSKPIEFQLSCIRKITLSPWLPESVAESIVSIIGGLEGCDNIRVNRSSLIDNAGWRSVID